MKTANFRVKWNFMLLTSDASWIFFWVKSLISELFHCEQRLWPTNANANECGVTEHCHYMERAYSESSRLWMVCLYMLAANKKVLPETTSQSVWWDLSLKFMKTTKAMRLHSFPVSPFLLLWVKLPWWNPLGLNKVMRHCTVCTHSGQDKVLGQAVELRLTHTQGTCRWSWPHADPLGGQGTGEPSQDRKSLSYFFH